MEQLQFFKLLSVTEIADTELKCYSSNPGFFEFENLLERLAEKVDKKVT